MKQKNNPQFAQLPRMMYNNIINSVSAHLAEILSIRPPRVSFGWSLCCILFLGVLEHQFMPSNNLNASLPFGVINVCVPAHLPVWDLLSLM